MVQSSTSPPTYYDLLKLHPTASVQQIRRAYRELSKIYHPDTTKLPSSIATVKFQQLNEAYATLSSPDRRAAYDLKIGYSRFTVIQPLPDLRQPSEASRPFRSSAYLDPTDRPLSAGELFALFLLGVTFVACLALILAVGVARGEITLQSGAPVTSEISVFKISTPEISLMATTSSSLNFHAAPRLR